MKITAAVKEIRRTYIRFAERGRTISGQSTGSFAIAQGFRELISLLFCTGFAWLRFGNGRP